MQRQANVEKTRILVDAYQRQICQATSIEVPDSDAEHAGDDPAATAHDDKSQQSEPANALRAFPRARGRTNRATSVPPPIRRGDAMDVSITAAKDKSRIGDDAAPPKLQKTEPFQKAAGGMEPPVNAQ